MRHAYLVAGLSFGDEGKGSIVDFLVRDTGSRLVVKYCGGPQCAHNVHTVEGQHHTFSQFGSGTLAGADTHIMCDVIIDPQAMVNEADSLTKTINNEWGINMTHNPDPKLLKGVRIERSCAITTHFHSLVNKAKEKARGASRHGSCGRGVGEVRKNITNRKLTLTLNDCQDRSLVAGKLQIIRENQLENLLAFYKQTEDSISQVEAKERDQWCHHLDSRIDIPGLAQIYTQFYKVVTVVDDYSLDIDGPVIFEGAQGTLLDENFGYAPYNTWSDVTFREADKVVPANIECTRIGVMRTYVTRHGAGPFPTEDISMEFADDNKLHPYQGPFRHGLFDMVAARYAIQAIGGVDMLALTHCDRLMGKQMTVVRSYGTPEGRKYSMPMHHALVDDQKRYVPDTEMLMQCSIGNKEKIALQNVEHYTGFKVGIQSWGRTSAEKIWTK